MNNPNPVVSKYSNLSNVWRFPKTRAPKKIIHGFSINNPAIGLLPWPWKPPWKDVPQPRYSPELRQVDPLRHHGPVGAKDGCAWERQKINGFLHGFMTGLGIDVPTIGDLFHITFQYLLEMKYIEISPNIWVMLNWDIETNPCMRFSGIG